MHLSWIPHEEGRAPVSHTHTHTTAALRPQTPLNPTPSRPPQSAKRGALRCSHGGVLPVRRRRGEDEDPQGDREAAPARQEELSEGVQAPAPG